MLAASVGSLRSIGRGRPDEAADDEGADWRLAGVAVGLSRWRRCEGGAFGCPPDAPQRMRVMRWSHETSGRGASAVATAPNALSGGDWMGSERTGWLGDCADCRKRSS